MNTDKYIRYEHKVEEYNCTYVILFDLCNKKFSAFYENLENSEKYYPPVDMEILKAINQQCKELGGGCNGWCFIWNRQYVPCFRVWSK